MAAKKKTTKRKATKAKAAPARVKVARPKNGVQYTQSEFYQCLTDCSDLESKRMAKDVYESFTGMLHSALKKGYKVPLPAIGKIQVRQTKARMGRNPATGEPIRISAKKRVRLTPNKALKDSVL